MNHKGAKARRGTKCCKLQASRCKPIFRALSFVLYAFRFGEPQSSKGSKGHEVFKLQDSCCKMNFQAFRFVLYALSFRILLLISIVSMCIYVYYVVQQSRLKLLRKSFILSFALCAFSFCWLPPPTEHF